MTEPGKEHSNFDFEAHGRSAVEVYTSKRPKYLEFAQKIKAILIDSFAEKHLRINEVQARAKEIDSFDKKARTHNDRNPEEPKYQNPLLEITDLAGVRVITFFPRTLADVCQCIQEEFTVIEKVDHRAVSQQQERLGYQSIHFLVKLNAYRQMLTEYARFQGLVAEIQVRTVMQHAWAEIEHDIRYKSASAVPKEISRRFMTLAGLLEIADREFEAIQTQDELLRSTANKKIEERDYKSVEITPDAVRSYLTTILGPDDRISEYTYEWEVRLLKSLGFQTLQQIHDCIHGLDDDYLSRIALGSRAGQASRFEVMLMAGMGEYFIENHTWAKNEGIVGVLKAELQKLKDKGVQIGSYRPFDSQF